MADQKGFTDKPVKPGAVTLHTIRGRDGVPKMVRPEEFPPLPAPAHRFDHTDLFTTGQMWEYIEAEREAAIAGKAHPEWAAKDMRILIAHLREDTHFDANLIEQMLAFAQRAAAPLGELQDEVTHLRSWYEPRMDMLGAWARAHLDRPQQETFFNIWANCAPSADGNEPEWLKAHRAARQDPVGAGPAQPDAWQMRRYYKGDDEGWGIWKECSADEAQKWKGREDIQVRALFAMPSR